MDNYNIFTIGSKNVLVYKVPTFKAAIVDRQFKIVERLFPTQKIFKYYLNTEAGYIHDLNKKFNAENLTYTCNRLATLSGTYTFIYQPFPPKKPMKKKKIGGAR